MAKILIYGWYGHSNVGDELMAEAMRSLLVGHELKFVDHIKHAELEQHDLVLIGGGSFLSMPVSMDGTSYTAISKKPVIYVGVGAETDVHHDHERLLKHASAVFVRSPASKQFAAIRSDAVLTPDISLALASPSFNKRPDRELLFIANSQVIPTRVSPNWQRAAWDYFKSETAQAIDELIVGGWKVTMAPFCDDVNHRDSWACAELIAHCVERLSVRCLSATWYDDAAFSKVRSAFDAHSVVVTQRYHGAIISQATGVPCVVVHHHDKLARLDPTVAKLVPYYGIHKDVLVSSIETAEVPTPVTNSGIFSQVRDAVEKALVKI
jgi:polysaccharide pyruvyl transferase WcaK-like protein